MRFPLLVLSALLLSCGGDGGSEVTAPETGSLEIRATTTGEPPADYMVAIDGESGQLLAPNGSISLTDLEPGFHLVQIVAPPPGCTVIGDNPRTVSIAAGSNNVVTFEINCVPLLGSIQVTITTSGAGPAAYDLLLDGTSIGPIGASATRSIEKVPPGSHTIDLAGVPEGCQAQSALPQTVNVEPSASAEVSIAITCAGTPVQTGTLTIITATTGDDPNGYQVIVDGGSPQPIGSNATLAILNTTAGTHSVLLDDLAANCTVTGSNPVSATVTPGGNTTVTFSLNCAEPNEAPVAEFTQECDGLECTFTSSSRDDDGVVESWSWDFGDGNTSEEENPSHTYESPGAYDVELTVRDDDGATDNVTREVIVSGPEEPAATTTEITGDGPDPSNPEQAVTVSFTVRAESGTPAGSVEVTTSSGTESCTGQLEDGAGSCELALTTPGDHTLTATYSGSNEFAGSSAEEEHFVRYPTSVSITMDPEQPEPGSEVEVSVLVESAEGAPVGTPTGNVTVSAGDAGESCDIVLENGEGSCSLTLEDGDETITAEYSGDDQFAPSSATSADASSSRSF